MPPRATDGADSERFNAPNEAGTALTAAAPETPETADSAEAAAEILCPKAAPGIAAERRTARTPDGFITLSRV